MFNFSKYGMKKRLTNILSIITFIICGSCLWAENIHDVNRLIQNEEYTQARIILEKLSKNDKTRTEANYNLGVIYNEGLGVKQDFNKAIMYFKKAADDRNIDAMINLGGLFISQLELQDIRKSYSWFLKAAELGDAQAAINFTWEILFLSPWELAYIALPMSVLAFYGLTIYSIFKYIQRKFS